MVKKWALLSSRIWSVVLVWIACQAFSALAQQVTADIVGTVTDARGAVVPGAQIAAESTRTQQKRLTTSSPSGEYMISELQPGNYTVVISAPGFRTVTIQSVVHAAGDRIRENAPLQIGTANESITVESATPAIQADSSVLSTTITTQQTDDLPPNGRNYIQLAQLVPGANEGLPDSLMNGSKLDDRLRTAAISVNGQSDVMNNQTIDGVDNNERLIGTVGVHPSVESIAEMNIQTNDYTAQVGRTGGGVINIITRSGTNQFHGSLFEYFRNNIFYATYWVPPGASAGPKTELRRNPDIFRHGELRASGRGCVSTRSRWARLHAAASSDQRPDGFQYDGSIKRSQISETFDVRVDHHFNASDTLFARFIYNNVQTTDLGPLQRGSAAGLSNDPDSDLT